MLFAWSLSGFVIPGIATALTAVFGTQAFMYVAIVIAAAFCAFVLWRLSQSPAAHGDGTFAPMSAQAPLPADLAFAPETDEATIWAASVPTATAEGMPEKISSGVIRKPPPTPNIPDRKPTAAPMPRNMNTFAAISAMLRPGGAYVVVGGPKTGTMLEHLIVPDTLPAWLSADDLAFYAGEFQRTGFRGGLNWYRCADLSWELTAAWADVRIAQPALFVAGDRDGVVAMNPGAVDAMKQSVPGLRDAILLPGCGHWTQQERPHEVNEALLAFLRGL